MKSLHTFAIMHLQHNNQTFQKTSGIQLIQEADFASEIKYCQERKGDDYLAALCVLLTAACSYDYRDRRIPNYLILLTAISGMGWRSWNGVSGILFYLGQALLVMLLLYPFFKIGGLGAGDVKLLGATAGYLPFEKVLAFLFYSLLVAAVISVIKMWRKHIFGDRMRYLAAYLTCVIAQKSWQPYRGENGDRHSCGICLSGPVLISMLLYLGGVY